MFVAIYAWRVKPGMEEQFREGWRRATSAIARTYGSFGSRLHKAEDGRWLGYAAWPDRARWQSAMDAGMVHDDMDCLPLLRAAVEPSAGGPLLAAM